MAQRFPESEIDAVISFFQHVKDRFAASDPATYDEFLRLLGDFDTGKSADPGKVMADVYALLRGHPDLVGRLDVLLSAREDPAPPKRSAAGPPSTMTLPTTLEPLLENNLGVGISIV